MTASRFLNFCDVMQTDTVKLPLGLSAAVDFPRPKPFRSLCCPGPLSPPQPMNVDKKQCKEKDLILIHHCGVVPLK